MPKCELCDKSSNVARKSSLRGSFVTRRTLYVQKPNLRKVKVVIDGEARRINVCTRCLRSGYLNQE